ncbi:lytic transglycosylase domain-containing protein [Rhizorhapis sp. SPR117]|nr:lytic transglycosylase domain-containing protein [Rhizorhapis sp. SPR117]
MSSMVSRIALLTALVGSTSFSMAAAPEAPQTDWQSVRKAIAAPEPDPLQVTAAVNEWRRLSQSDTLSFLDYASFLTGHPGWPGEERMRKTAEQAINPLSYSPSQVIAHFSKYPPLSNTGWARYAIALSASGRSGDGSAAQDAARRAWRGGALNLDDEIRLMSLFGRTFTAADHDVRMDALLWANALSAAGRQIAYTSPARRPVFEARLALDRKSPDALLKMQAAEAAGARDAGYIADKAMWLRDQGNSWAARDLLAKRAVVTTPPANPEKWYEALLTNARAAANDRQWSIAYAIASRVDDAYMPGTNIRDQPIGERDDYTSLVWLAGTAAYYELKRPRDAADMFRRYAEAARSPQTVSKGYYWAGRAAQEAGDTAQASTWLGQASAYADQFYGQLALERLGRDIPIPAAVLLVQVTNEERTAFYNRGVVQAARVLGRQGQWQDQSKFVRAIANNAITPADHLLADELSKTIGRPDLGVMAGRRANANGQLAYSEAGFPRISIPSGYQADWTMIHAIARQESQFDRQAVSHAGARGLMQLMPATARETAGKIGLSYTPSALTQDPGYNIQLGSTYFRSMLRYFGGSYPLAVAAYNAGPGNVNKWIAANGDPRLPSVDMLWWIENIPIYETKNYVQRVLENAVVYDLLNPGTAQATSKAPLSRYLGKNKPG